MNKRTMMGLAYAGVGVFVILAVVYFATPANHLPHFFPGYAASSTKVHVKHGIACLVLAIGCGVLGWFAGGPKPAASSTPE